MNRSSHALLALGVMVGSCAVVAHEGPIGRQPQDSASFKDVERSIIAHHGPDGFTLLNGAVMGMRRLGIRAGFAYQRGSPDMCSALIITHDSSVASTIIADKACESVDGLQHYYFMKSLRPSEPGQTILEFRQQLRFPQSDGLSTTLSRQQAVIERVRRSYRRLPGRPCQPRSASMVRPRSGGALPRELEGPEFTLSGEFARLVVKALLP